MPFSCLPGSSFCDAVPHLAQNSRRIHPPIKRGFATAGNIVTEVNAAPFPKQNHTHASLIPAQSRDCVALPVLKILPHHTSHKNLNAKKQGSKTTFVGNSKRDRRSQSTQKQMLYVGSRVKAQCRVSATSGSVILSLNFNKPNVPPSIFG